MIVPAFTFRLNDVIRHKLVAIGKFDGKHPSLTFGTDAGKICIHSPYSTDKSLVNQSDMGRGQSQTRTLNINKEITCVSAGRLDPTKDHDVVIVGTQTNLFAYDVDSNADVFYKEVPDGINAMAVGTVDGIDGLLAVVGGNCSIQGFDASGEEQFWTVTGDNVSVLTFLPQTHEEAPRPLLCGSDDYAIRLFHGEEVTTEVTESAPVTSLVSVAAPAGEGGKIGGDYDMYGYSLSNGIIGVYSGESRVWRVKSKHKPTAMAAFDLDADGVPEVVTGWTNGSINVRNRDTGEVVSKDAMAGGSAVAGIVQADYRCDGNDNIIICGADGEVRGYLATSREEGEGAVGGKKEEEYIEKLAGKKREMMMELGNVEASMVRAGTKGRDGTGVERGSMAGGTETLTAGTSVFHEIIVNTGRVLPELHLTVTNEACICTVVLIDEEGSVLEADATIWTGDGGDVARVPITTLKNTVTMIQCQVHVGVRPTSTTLRVFTLSFTLPSFCSFIQANNAVQEQILDNSPPQSSVSFSLNKSFQQVVDWLEKSFILTDQLPIGAGGVQVKFVKRRTDGSLDKLWIQVKRDDKLKVKVGCSTLALGGEVIQDLCRSLSVSELESTCSSPDEMARFKGVLQDVSEFHKTRAKLTADMADSSQRVKALVVKAEDARILGEMRSLRGCYSNLYGLNNELIGEYAKRANNHKVLLERLKEVNAMINKAANLRCGNAKVRVVKACREAIKKNNFDGLFSIITSGWLGGVKTN